MLKIRTIKFLDKYFGSLLCILLYPFNSRRKFTEPKSVLIIQLWGIGETILTLPAIRALRKKFPKAKITVLTTSRVNQVFYNNKDLNEIIILKLNPLSLMSFVIGNYRKYDLTVDFEEYLNISSLLSFFIGKYRIGFNHKKRALLYNKKISYNDQQHVVNTALELVNIIGADYKTDELVKLNYSKGDKEHVDELFRKYGLHKNELIIGICAGAAESAKSRMWPMGRFAELCDQLIEKYNAKIVFVGTKKENKLINEIQDLMKTKSINLAGKTNLRQLSYLIEKCRIFISNDTGPMHIAAAQGTKTIGLFGPNLPQRFAPYGKGNISIYKEQECSPCINVHKGQVPECKWHGKNYQKCMKAISIGDVLIAAEKLIR